MAFKKLYFENKDKNVKNPNYLGMNKFGGKWNIKDHKNALSQFMINNIANKYKWKCICAKTDKADSHRLWFDCDNCHEPTEKILVNIRMILIDNLVDPNTRSLVTMNIGNVHKRHIKYPDLYVNNSIRKALVEKINEKFGEKYVDKEANSGLRLELCNKWDKTNKRWVENSRYVKENGDDLELEELYGEYNILKEGKIIGVKKGLIEEVEKIQKFSKSKSINTEDLPEWVKLQLGQINKDDRFTNMISDDSMLDNQYIL